MLIPLQTHTFEAPTPAPAPEGIEWASPSVAAPADKRLDPRPATAGTATRLRPLAAVASLRQSFSARRMERIARRPELESIFPAGHPGFELRSERHATDAVDLDFAF